LDNKPKEILPMKIKTPASIASILLVSVFATGCSQQQQQADAGTSSSQAQNADACKDKCEKAPVVKKPVVQRPVVKKPAVQRPVVNNNRPAAPVTKPQIDVAELQRRLKAKGYYKGPIDGNLSSETKNALSAYQGKS
jgi:peptidoglycan hydrolase-like protein with peptidoglycan-binding domain